MQQRWFHSPFPACVFVLLWPFDAVPVSFLALVVSGVVLTLSHGGLKLISQVLRNSELVRLEPSAAFAVFTQGSRREPATHFSHC